MEKHNLAWSGPGATELSLEAPHPLSPHVSVCALRQAQLGLNVWVQLPGGGRDRCQTNGHGRGMGEGWWSAPAIEWEKNHTELPHQVLFSIQIMLCGHRGEQKPWTTSTGLLSFAHWVPFCSCAWMAKMPCSCSSPTVSTWHEPPG